MISLYRSRRSTTSLLTLETSCLRHHHEAHERSSAHGDLGKNHDPDGIRKKPLTGQPRSKNRYKIDAVLAVLASKVAQDEALSRKLAILVTIPGIGEITALAMLIEMPELGMLDGKQAASLAGLAPISRQSGKWRGKERIRGGRPILRRAIDMPALVATRFNADLQAKYQQLIRTGKPAKVALTAVMRKLVVMANALLRDGRQWSEIRP